MPSGIYKRTKEHGEKIGIANANRIITEKTRLKISLAHRGKKLTEEHKRKISETRIRLKIPSSTLGTKRPYAIGINNPSSRPEIRKKIAESKKGELNPNWKGGISPENILIRNSAQGRLWTISVFKQDNYTCQECGARNGNGKAVVLNAHHIKPFALFPELRFAIDNGVTLCFECHKKTDSYGWKITNYNQIKK